MGSLLCNVCLVPDNITDVLPIRINILCNMHQKLKSRAPVCVMRTCYQDTMWFVLKSPGRRAYVKRIILDYTA